MFETDETKEQDMTAESAGSGPVTSPEEGSVATEKNAAVGDVTPPVEPFASTEEPTPPTKEPTPASASASGNVSSEPPRGSFAQTPPPRGYAAYTYTPAGNAAYAGGPPQTKKKSGFLVTVVAVLTAAALLFGGAMLGRYVFPNVPDVSDPSNNRPSVTPSVDRGDVTIDVVERVNGIPDEGSLPAVVAAVSPSVVEIRTTTTVNSYYYDNYVQSGAGSGVIISASIDGLILTCNHVIDGVDAGGITVVLSNGRTFSGDQVLLLGQDVWSDLALLRIVDENGNAPENITGVEMARDSEGSAKYSYMTVGETVVAIGNPLGELGGSVSRGIISAVGREVSIEGCPMTLMQVDASVNPGNSGGGLFNMDGQLIGIVNAKSTGDAVEGIGFAIPTSDAIPLVEQLYRYGYVEGRPYLGLFFNSMTASGYYSISAYAYPEELPEGKTINYGDYLYSIGGTEITSDSALRSALAGKKEGDIVHVVLIRVQYRVQTKIELTLKVHAYTPEDAVHPTGE